MFERNTATEVSNRVKALMSFNRSFFIFFISLFYAFQLSASVTEQTNLEKPLHHSSYHYHGNSLKQHVNHPPTRSFPNLCKEESSNENEFVHGAGRQAVLLSFYTVPDFDVTNWSFVQNLFIRLSQSYENQPSVALFILHHSWKSFLTA